MINAITMTEPMPMKIYMRFEVFPSPPGGVGPLDDDAVSGKKHNFP
jgi:hypothetical protein